MKANPPTKRPRFKRWTYAKAVVNRVHVGQWLRLTHYAKSMGLQGYAKDDRGRVMRIDPPVGLVMRRTGQSGASTYFAGLWRV